jgi:hypothetical protein
MTVQNDDRNSRLRQIIADRASTPAEVVEAQRELTGTELPQAEEDQKILAALKYKAPEGACRPDYSPQYRYEKQLQALCDAVGHPDSCRFLRDRTEGENHVAILEALRQRTQSETIRAAVIRCIETAREVWQLE